MGASGVCAECGSVNSSLYEFLSFSPPTVPQGVSLDVFVTVTSSEKK